MNIFEKAETVVEFLIILRSNIVGRFFTFVGQGKES